MKALGHSRYTNYFFLPPATAMKLSPAVVLMSVAWWHCKPPRSIQLSTSAVECELRRPPTSTYCVKTVKLITSYLTEFSRRWWSRQCGPGLKKNSIHEPAAVVAHCLAWLVINNSFQTSSHILIFVDDIRGSHSDPDKYWSLLEYNTVSICKQLATYDGVIKQKTWIQVWIMLQL